MGQKINVLSDKAFRKSHDNEFEAIGNVVITHMKNAIYGEKAKLSFNTGDTLVEGNVRFISPGFTLYGTKLQYNFLTREVNLINARILADSYSIVGKKIVQTSPSEIVAEDAEYTTCKDCPESWSVFGNNIKITLGKYVRIKHAFIKMNGVIAMYIPYIVFPIKQNRESGLLFPTLSYKNDEGLRFQQPYFWAINDYMDMTFSPSVFGNRGYGGEFQYRHNFKEKTWTELNLVSLQDRIYEPYKIEKSISGQKDFRYFGDFEFHSIYKENLNAHLYYNKSSDLDTKRDLTYFVNDRILGTDIGGGGFLDYRFKSLFNFTFESYYNQNLLISDPRKFDDEYVQILPKMSLSTTPYNILHGTAPFLKNVSVGADLDYTIFKQNKFTNNTYIRNANRFNFTPYLNWQLGNLGPVYFSHDLKWDFQNYYLPKVSENSFTKRGFIYKTEAKFELDKVYGISYIEEKNILNNSEHVKNSNLLGELPSDIVKNENPIEYKYINSYRHSQEFKIRHYYLGGQKYNGNTQFYNQIQNDQGQFDYVDALRSREHSIAAVTVQDTLPLSNTIEFQWNNNLISKTSKKFDPFLDGKYLKDNFLYKNISYFDMSQGIDLEIKSSRFSDHLTRLYLNSGINFDQLTYSLQEFYFHKTGEHKAYTELKYDINKSKIGAKFSYNSFNSKTTPITKLVGGSLEWYLNDLFTVKSNVDYNIQSNLFSQSFYSLIYSPLNNCWKMELNYSKDLIEKKVGFIFYINYNENNFASINVH